MKLLAGGGVQDSGLDTEEGYGGRTRLGLNSTGEWSDNDGASLGLPRHDVR